MELKKNSKMFLVSQQKFQNVNTTTRVIYSCYFYQQLLYLIAIINTIDDINNKLL